MISKILMTTIAAGALLGATSLGHAQMSAPSAAGNEAAAQKQQDAGVNAEAQTKLVKPTSKAATAAKPTSKQHQARVKQSGTVGAASGNSGDAATGKSTEGGTAPGEGAAPT